jgi:xylulose-5-phosphate/fructose-6-phosphate phosphoketolase
MSPKRCHQRMAGTLDSIVEEIHAIQQRARQQNFANLPRWPMIILRSPKGWTGPKFVDGKPVEGTWRAHHVPVADLEKPEHLKILEDWMKSYHPEELFDESGKIRPDIAATAPTGTHRMGSNPHANGGLLLKALLLPDFRGYAVEVAKPGTHTAESTRVLGAFLRDVFKLNRESRNFRVFGPDETASNRLDAIYQVSKKEWMEPLLPTDENLSKDGRVMEVLSEHMCQGWLEGYLLTGRHGFFSCYEGFVHIVDSMFNQHAKWVEASHRIPWRRPIESELSSDLSHLAAGPQWLQPSRPWLRRFRNEQESGLSPCVSSAGRKLLAFCGRPLFAEPQLCERDRSGQATRVAVARYGYGHKALHSRFGNLAVGQQ